MAKKTLQSILLFLAVSFESIASDHYRYIGGDWDDSDRWSGGGGIPNSRDANVYLRNEETTPFKLDLKNGTYTIHTLRVGEQDAFGGGWTLSRGTLVFDRDGLIFHTYPLIEYNGNQTLTFATALDLKANLSLNVSDERGVVRLLGTVNNHGYEYLRKLGSETLLIEAPFHVDLHLGYYNEETKEWSSGGITGIAPNSLGDFNLWVDDDSKLFALGGDINLSGRLIFQSNRDRNREISLNIIDNPRDTTYHSITFSGEISSGGNNPALINQFSHGDLIFEGSNTFNGIINTFRGYGRVVLNGDTGANIYMNGGEIAGKGGTQGSLSATNEAIISPGYKDDLGTLSFKNVYLDSSTILNFRFGSSDNDKVQVDGNLTLAGYLIINPSYGFMAGTYTLFNYKGALTNNGLQLGSVPLGYTARVVSYLDRKRVMLLVDDNIAYYRSTDGSWDDHTLWNPQHVPGIPNSTSHAAINLYNPGPDSLDLNLKGHNYIINELNVNGDAWTLSDGTLTFDAGGSSTARAQIQYGGLQTLTFKTALHLKVDTLLNVSEASGTVRFLNAVTGSGLLTKIGSGTLLIEAPFYSELCLAGGTTGIAPGSLLGLYVGDDSELFALGGDLSIPETLKIYPGINFDIIDNPKDTANDRDITLNTLEGDGGTINQRSHGDLIFEGTDNFEGTIKTYAGYGRVVLNGDTAANIQMKGGRIAGKGKTRGNLITRNKAIISPGNRIEVGTLTFGDVYLDSSTILNFKLGSASDRIDVKGDLILAGKLNIRAASGFAAGTYTLFNYSSSLDGPGLDINSVPYGYDPFKFLQITTYANRVLILVPDKDEDPDDDEPPEDLPPDPPPGPEPIPLPPIIHPIPLPGPGEEAPQIIDISDLSVDSGMTLPNGIPTKFQIARRLVYI